MAALDLASTQDVKDWLAAGGPALGSSGDNVINRLITACSGGIYSYLSRQVIIPRTVTERYDGLGNSRVLLRNYPVLSVSSLMVEGTVFTAGTYPSSSGPSTGWPPSGWIESLWDGLLPGSPQVLDAFGFADNSGSSGLSGFVRGRQNVQVTYLCGYAVLSEAAVVPTAPPYQVAPLDPQGPWAADLGVSYSDGTAFVAGSSSSAGHYAAPADGVATQGVSKNYIFSSSDAGADILISYGFVPAAINTACIEWVAERYRYAGRIGQKSQSVSGNQTASYDTTGVPPFVKSVLDPYRCVVPFVTAWS